MKTGAECLTLSEHTDWVAGCAISPDGSFIVSASFRAFWMVTAKSLVILRGTEHIGVVVRLSRRAEGGVRYHAYQLWEFQDWQYSKSRVQIKALIAFCAQAASSCLLSYTGGVLPEHSIEDLLSCKILPVDVMKTMPCHNWHPQGCVSGDDKDKKSVWSEYKEYELDDLVRKYEYERSVSRDAILGFPKVRDT